MNLPTTIDFNILQDHYEPAISKFLEMLESGHRRYGTSYRDRSNEWMLGRLRGEEKEYFKARNPETKASEAMDCAICWVLIAHKHLLEGEGQQ